MLYLQDQITELLTNNDSLIALLKDNSVSAPTGFGLNGSGGSGGGSLNGPPSKPQVLVLATNYDSNSRRRIVPDPEVFNASSKIPCNRNNAYST